MLRGRVRRVQIDAHLAPGLTTGERNRLKELERGVRDLRRANGILKDASILSATQLDGRARKQCATSTRERIIGESSRSARPCSSLPPRSTTRIPGRPQRDRCAMRS